MTKNDKLLYGYWTRFENCFLKWKTYATLDSFLTLNCETIPASFKESLENHMIERFKYVE